MFPSKRNISKNNLKEHYHEEMENILLFEEFVLYFSERVYTRRETF